MRSRAPSASTASGSRALLLEPGRALVGRAGVTLYRVRSVKRLDDVTWVAVDGGMSDNPRPQLYGARYTALSATRADEPATETVSLAGLHCESGDVLIDDVDAAAAARRRPARRPCDGRVHARDELELQRDPAPGGGARARRRGARHPPARDRRRPARPRGRVTDAGWRSRVRGVLTDRAGRVLVLGGTTARRSLRSTSKGSPTTRSRSRGGRSASCSGRGVAILRYLAALARSRATGCSTSCTRSSGWIPAGSHRQERRGSSAGRSAATSATWSHPTSEDTLRSRVRRGPAKVGSPRQRRGSSRGSPPSPADDRGASSRCAPGRSRRCSGSRRSRATSTSRRPRRRRCSSTKDA